MLLAHLKDYYPKKRNKNCYVIMDNSLIELGGAVDVETVYNAAVQCDVDEFILPDVFQDGAATIKEVNKGIKWLKDNGHLGEHNLMAVCQGATLSEFSWCFRELEKIPQIRCIGIPKIAATLLPEGRPGLERLWRDTQKEIHLLGCWSNLVEFLSYERPAAIRSCDTCIPALLSVHHVYCAWANRPEQTIDLLNDRINHVAYETIIEQLREENMI
jgi:hypothetical protein